ncbi:Myb-related protein 3R-1 [Morus notabilis]|uniref:Myb-related protein 3R-1 n=1 Tax=Morus notabilis TaxID=981085 RepID=W9RKD7_9ROSA|nr:transcription factor MYB3R-1 [Morus notabilis]XP_024023842.1 transcription factor MYB3R-1 [Morus notabilis]EXB82278.1 Myb-related protein 3R-1 [Morus notabilis]
MESDRKTSNPLDGLGDNIQKIRALHGRTSGPTRRSTKGQWTPEEDEILGRAVQRFKGKNWKKIAECFKDRTDVQCLHRWQKVLNPELVKGPWSKEEDEIIVELVNKYGPKKWSTIAQHLPGRIGKQCRERWHNHLNPAINKEAWTQDEELALIRAHQIYGNKWAELTKFLPGRTDNSIKNHWNSSVKKKLDSYLKSGLLTQFQGLPQVGHQNQPMLSSSMRIQSSGDSGPKGTEAEEISECSQESTVAGHFHSANEMANVVVHKREEFQSTEVSGSGKEPNSSPASCSEPYHPSLEDPAFSMMEISNDIGCITKFLQQNFSHDGDCSISGDYQFDLHEIHNISSLEREPAGMHSHCLASNEGHEMTNVPLQTSEEIAASTSMGNMIRLTGSDKPQIMLISDDECCRVLFSEAMDNECFPSGNLDLGGFTGPLLCQSSNIQISEDGAAASQLHGPLSSNVTGTSFSQSFLCTQVSADDGPIMVGGKSNHLFGVQEQDYATCSRDGFIFTNDSANSPCDDGIDMTEMQEELDTVKAPSKLVPVNSFCSRSDTQTCSTDAQPNVHKEEQDAGALCYEPPRFPSFDVPFFSCDLVQSGGEMQQEYSPLGIRQLMMSSMNCLTPFRLWDSPTRDGSPDAVLKSAAKTFTGTPSILKKRHREFLSPLSDRRNDKKLETDMTSRLSKDFSRLDVMFDACVVNKRSSQSPSSKQNRDSSQVTEDEKKVHKVNEGNKSEQECQKASDNTSPSGDRNSGKVVSNNEYQENKEQGAADVDDKTKNAVNSTSQPPSGVLTEHNMNDLQLFSPKQHDFRADKVFASISRTSRNHLKRFEPTPSKENPSKSSSGKAIPFTSPSISRKKVESLPVAETSAQHDPSSVLMETVGCTAGRDATIETFSIFGETPFKRSIESPSAWKSPWFINSFVPGPRIDTDITIEDIGYLMSPGDRSYDAIGLMKQISEQTAAAYANAQEVLESGTPKTLLKEIFNRDTQEQDNNQQGTRSNMPQNILAECRVLDFGECGTPGKGAEHGIAIGFSSPSSYLLKSCR